MLSTSMFTEPDMKQEVIQRAQVSSLMGANGNKEPQDKTPKKQSPASATRPKKYALEMWVEIETSTGVHSLLLLDHSNLRPLRSHPERMMRPEPTLFDMDWQGVVLLRVVLPTHLWEGHSQAITNPLMMTGYPQIRSPQMDPSEGGVGAEEAEVAGVVVTLMGPAPLGEDVRKRMDFQVKSRFQNLEARRAMLMM